MTLAGEANHISHFLLVSPPSLASGYLNTAYGFVTLNFPDLDQAAAPIPPQILTRDAPHFAERPPICGALMDARDTFWGVIANDTAFPDSCHDALRAGVSAGEARLMASNLNSVTSSPSGRDVNAVTVEALAPAPVAVTATNSNSVLFASLPEAPKTAADASASPPLYSVDLDQDADIPSFLRRDATNKAPYHSRGTS